MPLFYTPNSVLDCNVPAFAWARAKVEALEGQLAWCVNIAGSVIGGMAWSGTPPPDAAPLDGELAKRCFAVAQVGSHPPATTTTTAKRFYAAEMAAMRRCALYTRVHAVRESGAFFFTCRPRCPMAVFFFCRHARTNCLAYIGARLSSRVPFSAHALWRQAVDFRAEASGGASLCDEALELALVAFLGHLRRVYLADAIGWAPQ